MQINFKHVYHSFRSMRSFMMTQSICPAAVFCPFWIFIILLILYLVFFAIWIWIQIGCQWLGTGHKHKRFDESAKTDRLIHLLGGYIRITKSLVLISWIFFIFTIILVILVCELKKNATIEIFSPFKIFCIVLF